MSESTDGPATDRSALGALWAEFGRGQPAADGVYATLREAIVSGRLRAGERLGEEYLARSFGVSRTPVREAILRLETEHLALREERRGAVVRGIREQEVLEVYAVRAALDGLAAELAASMADPADHARLRWLNDRLADAAARSEFQTMAELNIQFHEALCEAARNTTLLRFMRQIHDWVRRFGQTTFAVADRAGQAVAEHRAVLDAIERGDAALAERLAREHMNRAREVRLAMLRRR